MRSEQLVPQVMRGHYARARIRLVRRGCSACAPISRMCGAGELLQVGEFRTYGPQLRPGRPTLGDDDPEHDEPCAKSYLSAVFHSSTETEATHKKAF